MARAKKLFEQARGAEDRDAFFFGCGWVQSGIAYAYYQEAEEVWEVFQEDSRVSSGLSLSFYAYKCCRTPETRHFKVSGRGGLGAPARPWRKKL